MHKLATYDLETTGIDEKKNRITEIAFKYYDLKTGEKDQFHRYIKYDSYPDNYDDIAKITGLTPEILSEKGIAESNVYYMFNEFLESKIDRYDPEDKIITAGYNISKFDDQFLREFFERHNNKYYGSFISFLKIDIVSLLGIASLLNIIPKLDNNKLETYKKYFKITGESHSAIDDVGTTEKLFYRMMQEIYIKYRSDQKIFSVILNDKENKDDEGNSKSKDIKE